MRVLITGVSGFVGRHLAERCAAQGATVIGVGRRPELALDLPDSVEIYIPANLLDAGEAEQALQSANPDRIFHLAAEASVARSWEDPTRIMTGNLTTTLNVLEATRRHAQGARVLVAGSGEEYGIPEQMPVVESMPLRPQSPYAVGKVAADHAAGFYADAYDLYVVRTRAFNHVGPGQSPAYVVASFASQIAEAETTGTKGTFDIAVGNTAVRRDFTDVRDVCRAYWMGLESCAPGVYNVCSGRSVAVSQILSGFDLISKVDLRGSPDPRLRREHEVMEIEGSNERLRQACGWEPEIRLQQTLLDTLNWWRERTKKGEGVV
jgi:GDP-4-dehydro-6-deoxy-D-mannose reductase